MNGDRNQDGKLVDAVFVVVRQFQLQGDIDGVVVVSGQPGGDLNRQELGVVLLTDTSPSKHTQAWKIDVAVCVAVAVADGIAVVVVEEEEPGCTVQAVGLSMAQRLRPQKRRRIASWKTYPTANLCPLELVWRCKWIGAQLGLGYRTVVEFGIRFCTQDLKGTVKDLVFVDGSQHGSHRLCEKVQSVNVLKNVGLAVGDKNQVQVV
ncbi:hypothetical protein WICPIJ_008622 [Wickerhamomyces pijperi]|uniref:Uncharacterized protein n=1 Tax=Wickerhamomyces pijperi TaxID=599730 RepID=A0A9P8PY42_WICPI|nr:hypothetical protein WICPIJ_008622 [Wickerhamomyces pijperi]